MAERPGGGGGRAGAGGGAAGGTNNARGNPPMGQYGQLRVTQGNDRGKLVELNKILTTIGRGADQELVLADIAVSRRHAIIHLTNTGYRLEDLRSGNGTLVNGKRVDEVNLVDGDTIELGNTSMRFEHPPSRAAEVPPPPAPQPPPPQPMAPPPMMMPQQPMPMPMAPQGYAPQGYPQPGVPSGSPYASNVMPVVGGPPAYPQANPYGSQVAQQAVAGPSMVQPVAAMAPAMSPPTGAGEAMGGGFLSNPKSRTMAFGGVGLALVVGLAGLGFQMTQAPPANNVEQVDKLFKTGAADFTAGKYDSARKAFADAQKLAPRSDELARYLAACDVETRAQQAIDAGKRDLGSRSYGKALDEFQKVEKGSVQYEDAQGLAQDARREAVQTALTEARNLAMTDKGGAEAKVAEGLRYDPQNGELLALRDSLKRGPSEPVAVADPPPPEPKAPREPPKVKPPKPPKATPTPAAESGGDLKSNKTALSAYQRRDFGTASAAMQNFAKVNKGAVQQKAQQTARDIDELRGVLDRAGKAEGSNPAGASADYGKAQGLDKRISGGELAGFISGKLAGLKGKGATPGPGPGPKPVPFAGNKPGPAPTPGPGPKPAGPADPAKDQKAEQMLSEAEKIKGRDPIKARLLCRQVVKLYAGSNPTSPMVQRAIRLQNSIPSKDEDED